VVTQVNRPDVVLLTGATGFVGKVVLAELLRTRPGAELARVYVLIRSKKGKTPAQRFAEDVAPARLFDALPADWAARVTPVAGELAEANGGLSDADLARLQGELTHIVHCAASVDFDLPVAEAAEANILSALHVLDLAKGCAHLQRMVSVSTAYVTPWQAGQGPIPAALVPLPFDPAQAYADMRAGKADQDALMAKSGHPNTYTLTKCVAEHLLVANRGSVPLTIVRPSIVSATLHHPFPGWIDSAAAFAGFVALIGAGQMKVLVADGNSALDVIPCDAVAEVVLGEAFRADAPTDHVPFLHAAAGGARNLSIRDCIDGIVGHYTRHPADRRAGIVWDGPFSKRFQAHEFRHHTIPFTLAKAALKVGGQHKQAKFVDRIAGKLKYVNRSFKYFTHNRFDFADARPTVMPDFEQKAYIDLVCGGVRRQILKLDRGATPLAGKRFKGTKGDLRWALSQPNGNGAIRSFGYVLRKATRRSNDLVSVDLPSFERALAAVPPGTAIVLVPSHRSYMDFLFCSYLFFAHPELGVRIPHIAAAEEFSRIPLLGKMFTWTHAFYLKRGVGREDPDLTRIVHGLVAQGEVLQFFIEGTRSRSRQFLQPKTGLLRCLQATGKPVAVLPIAITYDRVPEEAVLARELAGEPKPAMQLRALLAWAKKMAAGQISLGRIHLACGHPVRLGPDDDVKAAARLVMAELQRHVAVSTYHLRAFAARTGQSADAAVWLAAELRRRGATVIDSPLGSEDTIDPVTELSLRQQWLPWFLDDALARWPGSPILAHEKAFRRFTEPTGAEPDARVEALLDAMFAPLLRDAVAVADLLGGPAWSPRFATPANVLVEAREVNLLHAQAVFEDLTARGVLARDADGLHVWGPNADGIEAYRAQLRASLGALDADVPGGARRLLAGALAR